MIFNRMNTRRNFVKQLAGGAALLSVPSLLGFAEENKFPVRAITKGPKFHWFGYYDKLQFDPTGRYLLGMEVNFEHRSPGPEDEIRIGG